MTKTVHVNIEKGMFGSLTKRLVDFGELTVDSFLYASGVEALEIRNSQGGVIVLPYHGQQIWRCGFHGRELTMRSLFDEPTGSRNYLENYGGFLLHCGATAMGVPSAEDSHPLHGELPNAPYHSAEIIAGERDGTPYISLSGGYEHRVAFNVHYMAEPTITLTSESSLIDVKMEIKNLRGETMPLMYMMHINHKPEDDAKLIYSAPKTPDAVRVHNSVPGHMRSERIEDLKAFMDRLESQPDLHHTLSPDLPLDPEVVFSIEYEADDDGWAHTLMKFTDGMASYVSHRPDELPVGIRWLSRKADEEAAGIVLPATAEHKGFSAELEKGNMKYLAAGESRKFHVKTGLLTEELVDTIISRIETILNN